MPKKQKDSALAWGKLSHIWGRLKPLLRPSGGELRIYEKHVRNLALRRNPQALLLGATPELRDILAKYNLKVTMIDINPEVVKAMTTLRKRRGGREKIIIGDWLDIPHLIKKEKYDLILGDHPLGLIRIRNWDKFLKGLTSVLKPDGYVLLNIVTNLFTKALSFKALIKLYY